MRRVVGALLLVLVALFLVACGGTKTVVAPGVGFVRASGSALVKQCPPGHSYMGCAVQHPSQRLRGTVGAPRGPLLPDVYEGQGQVGWGAVAGWQRSHGWRAAAIFKLGEYRIDFQAARNASVTAALGFWRSGYWFVRDTGCRHEADQITSVGRQYRIVVISLDLEVPEAHGYGRCLSPILRARGFIVVEYTSPGSNPGGVDTSDPEWIATFGSGFACIWTCSPVAWQFTDGEFGGPVFIPGIGQDDVNVDYGITRLGGPPPAPPDPYAIYLRIRLRLRFGKTAVEHNVVASWDSHGCRNRVIRQVCKSDRFLMQLLRDRDVWVAHHRVVHGHWITLTRARYDENYLGPRVAGFEHRLTRLGSRRWN